MTDLTAADTTSTGRARPVRRKRPHPAARARIVAAGLAGTAAFTMVAGMALPHLTTVAAPAPATTQSVPADTRSVSPAPAPVPASSFAPAPVTSSSGS